MLRRTVLTGLLLSMALPGAAQEAGVRAGDERALIRLVDGVDVAVDTKRWEDVRKALTKEVFVDTSALDGSEPGRMLADELVEGWRQALAPPMESFHMRSNHLISFQGDKATLTSYGYAWNRRDGDEDSLWEIWGTYEYGLERTGSGWKINRFVFRPTYERGERP